MSVPVQEDDNIEERLTASWTLPGTEESEACEAPWPFSLVEVVADEDIVRLTIAESVVVEVVDCLSVRRESMKLFVDEESQWRGSYLATYIPLDMRVMCTS